MGEGIFRADNSLSREGYTMVVFVQRVERFGVYHT